MTNITFTIPSVLNGGAGEKKIELDADTLKDAFTKISETMGDDFKRRVLNEDGTPRSLVNIYVNCLLYTSPSPRDYAASRMPSSA